MWKKTILFIFAVSLALLFSGCIQLPKPEACTLEAKLCPDGSYVARNPALDCEFDACPNPYGLKIVLEKGAFAQGEKINYYFVNTLNESIFLPGCNEFELEILQDSAWQRTVLNQCIWEGNSIEVKPGQSRTVLFNAPSLGTMRILITASVGCVAGKPISQAKCSDSFAIRSSEFTIT